MLASSSSRFLMSAFALFLSSTSAELKLFPRSDIFLLMLLICNHFQGNMKIPWPQLSEQYRNEGLSMGREKRKTFLYGHLCKPPLRQTFFITVGHTFNFLAASSMVRWRYPAKSFNLIFPVLCLCYIKEKK